MIRIALIRPTVAEGHKANYHADKAQDNRNERENDNQNDVGTAVLYFFQHPFLEPVVAVCGWAFLAELVNRAAFHGATSCEVCVEAGGVRGKRDGC